MINLETHWGPICAESKSELMKCSEKSSFQRGLGYVQGKLDGVFASWKRGGLAKTTMPAYSVSSISIDLSILQFAPPMAQLYTNYNSAAHLVLDRSDL